MAALFWNSEVRTLTPGTANISNLKIVIENDLMNCKIISLFACRNVYTDPCHSSLSNPK
jgi:hypothetical protein